MGEERLFRGLISHAKETTGLIVDFHRGFRDLRRLKRTDLAAQVMSLHIVDRCRGGSEACGTFYTLEPNPGSGCPGTEPTSC